ncbi:MAG: flagellar basal body P-ring formation chaperone FlgA [Planctomycetota bacterium]
MLSFAPWLLSFVLGTAGEPLEVVLDQQALVARAVFTIGDVAELSPADHPLRAAVLAIPLGPAPRPRATRIVTTQGVLFALQDHGIDLARVKISGAVECQVAVRPSVLKGEDLLERAKAYLAAEIKTTDPYELEAPDAPPDIDLPAFEDAPVIRFDHGKNPVAAGPVRVSVAVDVGGQTYTRIALTFRLRLFADVYVAASFIARGTTLVSAPIVPARVERSVMRGEPLVSLEQLNGLVARRDVREGEMLCLEDGVRPIVLKSGDPVTIVVTRGQLTITAKGQARGDGAVGDLVAVQNLDTKRVLKARIDGPGLVSVP